MPGKKPRARLPVLMLVLFVLFLTGTWFALTALRDYYSSDNVLRRFAASLTAQEWDSLLEELPQGDSIRRDSPCCEPVRLLFERHKDLQTVFKIDENSVSFSFDWLRNIEGSKKLILHRPDEFPEAVFDADPSTILETVFEEDTLTVTFEHGHPGMYLKLTRILPGWFLFDAYLPT